MTAETWVRVTACDNIPLREGRAVIVGGRELALFNLGDRFLATDNRCPHKGGPLCDGIVTGASVVCPLHAWKVNLESGFVERPAGAKDHCVQTFPTRVQDGIISIELPALHPPASCGAGPASSSVPADPPAIHYGAGAASPRSGAGAASPSVPADPPVIMPKSEAVA